MLRFFPCGQLLPAFFSLSMCAEINAAGMIPETSVVLIKVAEGEGSINVRNSDAQAALLHTSLENIEEDTAELLVVVPPVARVEPEQSQRVRFIVTGNEPIVTQRLKRVSFEGIPQKTPGASSRISISVRQNLPVVLHPANLALKSDPWTLLNWSLEGDRVRVRNPSPYVIRLQKSILLQPGSASAELPNTYLLPGQDLALDINGQPPAALESVRLFPASLYGFQVPAYDAPLNGAVRN